MAHLTDGTLRRMVDDPDARVGADAAHLDGCADCKARLESITADAHTIASLLAVPDARVDVARAFDRVKQAPKSAPVLGFRLPLLTSTPRRLTFALAAAVMAAALVVVAFAAGGFFYQPTTVQAVPVTAVDIQSLSQLSEYGTFEWVKQPNFTVATSATEANNAAGILEPTVGWVPSTISSTVTYGAMTDAQATFTFSAAKAQAAAASHGTTAPAMPSGLDGAKVTVSAGPAVGMLYGELPKNANVSDPTSINIPQLIVLKTTAPSVKSDSISLDVLESYLLQVAGPNASTGVKNAIEALTDPNMALFVPVPVDFVTSTPYTNTKKLPGSGVALGDNTGAGAGVVWISGGYVYVVVGSVSVSDAKAIADNLS